MLGWIINRWRRSRMRRERLIFNYMDGTQKRSADPTEIERILIRHLGRDWRGKLQQYAKPVPAELVGTQAIEAQESKDKLRATILVAIDDAFGVKPYKDGEGLTTPERWGLLEGYQRYILELVEYASPFVNVQSRDSPTQESQPIENGVDSTSHAMP